MIVFPDFPGLNLDFFQQLPKRDVAFPYAPAIAQHG